MDTPIIGDDLCIRAFQAGDVSGFTAAARESVRTVGAWMPWCRADYAEADARLWIGQCLARIRAASAYDVGIFARDGVEILGGVGINQLNTQHNFANIGYWVRESCQRRAIATRAVRMMAAFGFETLKLTRLEIVAAVDNRPSRRVAEKVGATFECIARNRLIVAERPVAAAVYSLTPGWDAGQTERRSSPG